MNSTLTYGLFLLTVETDSHFQEIQLSPKWVYVYAYCFFELFLTQIAPDTTRLFLRTLGLKNLRITVFHLRWSMQGGEQKKKGKQTD